MRPSQVRPSALLAIVVAGAALALAVIPSPAQPPPSGNWQKPGEIQQPKGTWQVPGDLQVPHGIQAVKEEKTACEQRLSVVADALFAFNQAALSPQAEETLAALGPEITKRGDHPVTIEGHTDAIGTAAANQRLSEQRAESVKSWLVAHHFVAAATPIKGYGKTKPVAPNTNPDGSDNPVGRQKNRRVEVVIRTCP